MRKKPLKRKTGLKRTPIRKVSVKLSKELRRYYVLREMFLRENPYCIVGLHEGTPDRVECGVEATQVHHSKRRGKYLNDVSTFVPVCATCHAFIESHGKWARDMGWLLT